MKRSSLVGPSGDALHTTLTPRQRTKLAGLLAALHGDYPPSSITGLGGTRYHLVITCAAVYLELKWWQTVPADWVGVADLVDEVLLLVEAFPPARA